MKRLITLLLVVFLSTLHVFATSGELGKKLQSIDAIAFNYLYR